MQRILLTTCILFTACSTRETCEIPLTNLGQELKASVIDGFRSHNINYDTTSDGDLCVAYTDAQSASAILAASVNQLIPRETSRSMDARVHQRVVERLRNNDIAFKVQQLDGHNFLVWHDTDDTLVRQIIDEEFELTLNNHAEH
ncbi:MAG: hypothetical protein ACLGH6_07420 [Gammaproteobacteria bacterium]